MKKRLTAILLLSVMVFCSACGSGSSSKKSKVTASEVDMDTVFQSTAVKAGLDEHSFVRCLAAVDGGYSAVVSDWTDDSDFGKVISFSQEGEVTKTTQLTSPGEGGSLSGTVMDGSGNIYQILDNGSYDDDDNYTPGAITLYKISSDGSTQWSRDLHTPDEKDTDGGSFTISSLIVDPKGETIYIAEPDASKIDALSTKDGSETGSCKLTDDLNYGNLAADGDGDILYSCDSLFKVDIQKGELEEIKSDDFSTVGSGMIYSGNGSEVYTDSSDALYSVDVNTGKVATFINFVASDMDVNSVRYLSGTDSEHFAAVYDDDYGNDQLITLAKADPDIYKNKTILTLGCSFTDPNIRRQVISFNQNSDRYRVNLVQYTSDSDDDSVYGSALNEVILSGDMPDMLLLDYGQDYTSYEKKGVFEPLDSYFGKNGPSDDEYLTNIFDARRVGGKMYILPLSFSVRCLVGKQSDFGDVTGTTIAQIEQVAKKRGIKISDCMGPYETKDTFLMSDVIMDSAEYIDFDSGKCSFDTDQFKDILAFANQFPEDTDDDVMYKEDGLRNGTQILMDQSIMSFENYNEIITAYVGEPAAIMGYPGNGKAGPAISVDNEIAMSASSRNKDACWEFMQSLIGDDVPQSIYTSSFPVNIKVLEKLRQNAMTQQYTQDENGQKEPVNNTVMINDQEITVDPLTKDEADTFENLLKSLDTVIYYGGGDNSVYSIVSEEAEPYFKGQKSVDDVADTIQRRVNILINENK